MGSVTSEGEGTEGQPTLETVAARARVSRATVSRVLNGSPNVSALTHESVMRAVSELGYLPNRAARSLVTRRSDSVALLVSEDESRLFADPFFAGVVRGATSELADTDIQVVLAMAQNRSERERFERYATGRHVDGVLLVSEHGDDPLPQVLQKSRVPVVLLGRPHGRYGRYYVDADNLGGARRAVTRLIDQGRQRIGTIAGPQDMSPGVDRLEGYYKALREVGMSLDAGLVVEADFSEEGGARAAESLLRARPHLDGLFVASDLMAAGALRVLRARGRSVPDSVAIVGFDDSVVARQTSPQLTTIRQPVEELGRRMTRLLLRVIDGDRIIEPHVILETKLVVRKSG